MTATAFALTHALSAFACVVDANENIPAAQRPPPLSEDDLPDASEKCSRALLVPVLQQSNRPRLQTNLRPLVVRVSDIVRTKTIHFIFRTPSDRSTKSPSIRSEALSHNPHNYYHCNWNYNMIAQVILVLSMLAQAASRCIMCADGTTNLDHPNRIIPFFNLDGGNANPTCQEVAGAAEVADPRTVDCSLVQAQAGYCGCAGEQPKRECSFCPNGPQPANMDLVTTSTDVCGDLFAYAEYLSAEDCSSRRFQSMEGLAYNCGCPGVKPQCSLCPNGEAPPLLDKEAQATGETCQEMIGIIEAFTADVCVDSDTTIFVAAARCGCQNSDFPVCAVQQNSFLCTHELLDTAQDEDCECFQFCDGKFAGCSNYPGGILSPQVCTGVPLSGCNRALASTSTAAGGESNSARRQERNGFWAIMGLLASFYWIV
jgi:hypothetical protein